MNEIINGIVLGKIGLIFLFGVLLTWSMLTSSLDEAPITKLFLSLASGGFMLLVIYDLVYYLTR